MTEQEAVSRVLAIARDEVGYREKISNSGLDDKTANAGGGNYTKYARDLDRIPGFYNGPKQGFAWCDVFYDWLLVKAFGAAAAKKLLCQPDNSAGAGCLYSLAYYQQHGQYHPANPQPGDQIFFTYAPGEISHTGIVEAVNGNTVTTIEGNTGDGVFRRTYQLGESRVYGFGSPDWSLVASVSESDTETEISPDEPAEAPQAATGEEYQITLQELREGDTGVRVERLQTLLIGRGYYCGGRSFNGVEHPDGEFGPSTKVAVMDVQLSKSLQQDGVVGQQTMMALLTT